VATFLAAFAAIRASGEGGFGIVALREHEECLWKFTAVPVLELLRARRVLDEVCEIVRAPRAASVAVVQRRLVSTWYALVDKRDIARVPTHLSVSWRGPIQERVSFTLRVRDLIWARGCASESEETNDCEDDSKSELHCQSDVNRRVNEAYVVSCWASVDNRRKSKES
jgi:hypothetical protein